ADRLSRYRQPPDWLREPPARLREAPARPARSTSWRRRRTRQSGGETLAAIISANRDGAQSAPKAFGSVARDGRGGVGFGGSLKGEKRGLVRPIEMPLEVGRLARDNRGWTPEHGIGIPKPQPFLRLIMQIARELGRAFGRFQFQKQARLHRILQRDRETQ